MIADSVH